MTGRGMNNCNTAIVVVLIAAVTALAGFSCKAREKIDHAPLKEQGPEYLFEQMKKNELKYNTFYAKFSAEAEIDNNNSSLSGVICVRRDSTIWLNISKFGLEVARFLITPDSAKMVDRINEKYFIGDFNYVCGLFKVDFDFDMLQALILGNDFSYYDNNVFKASVDIKNYKLSTIGRRKLKKFVLQSNDEQRVLVQDIWLDPVTFKIVRISMKELGQESRKFESLYEGFDLVGEQRFPYNVKFEINDEKKKIKIGVWYTRVSLNTNEVMPFKIPEGYKRMEK
jgi:hypothetical protein